MELGRRFLYEVALSVKITKKRINPPAVETAGAVRGAWTIGFACYYLTLRAILLT